MWDHANDWYCQRVDSCISEMQHKDDIKKNTHTDQYWNTVKIEEMTTNHIKNTIKFFQIYDYSDRLYKELERRWVFWKIVK
jgi:hypothetical protein